MDAGGKQGLSTLLFIDRKRRKKTYEGGSQFERPDGLETTGKAWGREFYWGAAI